MYNFIYLFFNNFINLLNNIKLNFWKILDVYKLLKKNMYNKIQRKIFLINKIISF